MKKLSPRRRKTMNRVSLISLAIACGFASPALAGSVMWAGGVSNDWFTDGNWVWDGHTPIAGDQARIDASGALIAGSAASVGTLFLGLTTTATLDVTSSLASDNVSLGYNAGSAGVMTFSGSGVSWTNSQDIYVGQDGTGTVNMLAGADGSTNMFYIGSGAGTGTVNLQDGSTFDVASNLYVGFGGTGYLNVLSGSSVTANIGIIADGLSSVGAAVVDGANSTFTLTDSLGVGSGGVGSLLVSDGGSVEVGGDASIANLASASGSSATVTGSGSTWSVGGILYAGVDGDATLTVEDGAVVDSTTLYVGLNAASESQVTVDDATLITSDRIGVGYHGTGSLLVENGGSVISNGAIVGWDTTGSGSAIVRGGGSSWDNSGVLFIGNVGDGTLEVSAGASVTSTDGYVASEDGSDSSALITGFGSSWIMTGAFLVAHNSGSIGEVTIADGGVVSGVQGIIGDLAGSDGAMTVTGSGSVWEARVETGVLYSGDLNVGRHGDGELLVSAGGSVIGNRLHIGNETGSSGEVLVTGSGSNITVTDRLSIGLEGSGELTVREGGLISAETVTIATGADAQGTLNIGAARGQSVASAGVVIADEVEFGDGDGEIVFNHTSTGYDFSADVSGAGTLSFLAGTTILSGDYSGYTGEIEIDGGLLTVNTSTLDAVASVLDGATLGGTGTLGNVLVASGGTIAPGNSIGTLTVADMVLASGSLYSVEIDDSGDSDLVHATGTVTIEDGAELEFGPENGTDDGRTYVSGTVYTILTADGGLTGTFDTVSEDFAFLDGTVTYDGNNAYLMVERNDLDFSDLGTTANQMAVGGALDSLGVGSDLYNVVASLTSDEVTAAYDALSGEIHASTRGVLLEDSHYVRDAINDRLIDGRDGKDEKAFWMSSYGGWSEIDGDGNAASLDRSIGGFMAGADADLSASWTLGVAGGYSRSSLSVDDRASTAASDNYSVGVYGGTVRGPVNLRLGGSFTWHDIDVDRAIDVGALEEDLSSGYSAYTGQLFAEAGYLVEANAVRFEPFAGLAYVHLGTDSFQESAGTASLSGDAASDSVGFSTLGVRLGSQVEIAGAPLLLSGSVAWKHVLGETVASTQMRFDGSDGFSVSGVPLGRDVAAVEAGFGFALGPSAGVGVSYAGQFGSGVTEHQAKARLEIRF